MPSMAGQTVATMNFQYLAGGVTRTAVVQLTARRTGGETEDLTFQVGQILAQALIAQTGYTLVTADLTTETATRVYPPA